MYYTCIRFPLLSFDRPLFIRLCSSAANKKKGRQVEINRHCVFLPSTLSEEIQEYRGKKNNYSSDLPVPRRITTRLAKRMTENRNALEEVKFICDHAVNLNCKFVVTDGSERRMCKQINQRKTQSTDVSDIFLFNTRNIYAKINEKALP